MRPKTTERKHRRIQKLFERQDGRCFYCKCKMILQDRRRPFKKPPPNMATLEHLDDRFSQKRGSFTNKNVERTVLACLKCNNSRGAERDKLMAYTTCYYQVSCSDFTAMVGVRTGKIVEAAPILKKFIDQDYNNLINFLKSIGDYKVHRLRT